MKASAPEISIPTTPCVTRAEFAVMLQVSERTVDRMIAAGEIRARHIRGKMVRIPRAEAERVLNGEKLNFNHQGHQA